MKEGILLVITDYGRRNQRSFGGATEILTMYQPLAGLIMQLIMPLTKDYKKIRWIWNDSLNYDKHIKDAQGKNWDIIHKGING
jgi:hypothetical protein